MARYENDRARRASEYNRGPYNDYRDDPRDRDLWGNPLPDARPGIWGSTFTAGRPRFDGEGREGRDYGSLASPEYRDPRWYEPRRDIEYRDAGARYEEPGYRGGRPRPEEFLDERDESWSAQLGRDPFAPEPGNYPLSPYYAAGDRGEHAGRGPRNYRRDDGRIHEDVCEMLTRHGRLDASDLEVDVKDGEVCLRGTVDTRSQKRLAEDIAWQAAGVRDVRNDIHPRTMMAERGDRSITVGEGALSSRRGD
ncbi:MAG: BON domain-containing protein [Dehalococcoidia bacterium]